jgi:hypothetical protein
MSSFRLTPIFLSWAWSACASFTAVEYSPVSTIVFSENPFGAPP